MGDMKKSVLQKLKKRRRKKGKRVKVEDKFVKT